MQPVINISVDKFVKHLTVPSNGSESFFFSTTAFSEPGRFSNRSTNLKRMKSKKLVPNSRKLSVVLIATSVDAIVSMMAIKSLRSPG